MPLPDTIPVRYTEDEAGYVSIRPVVRQTFRLTELLDMVVSVTGKDGARVAQMFRAGTIVYNGYRYWWQGFVAEASELAALLAPIPEDDASRPFRTEEAIAVLFEFGGGTQRTPVELTRAEASARRLFHRRSVWNCAVETARASIARYEHYSHARRADRFRVTLQPADAERLLREMLAAAPRGLRARLSTLYLPSALVFLCPRAGALPRDARP